MRNCPLLAEAPRMLLSNRVKKTKLKTGLCSYPRKTQFNYCSTTSEQTFGVENHEAGCLCANRREVYSGQSYYCTKKHANGSSTYVIWTELTEVLMILACIYEQHMDNMTTWKIKKKTRMCQTVYVRKWFNKQKADTNLVYVEGTTTRHMLCFPQTSLPLGLCRLPHTVLLKAVGETSMSPINSNVHFHEHTLCKIGRIPAPLGCSYPRMLFRAL